MASNFLKKHQEIQKENIINEDNKPCGKSNNNLIEDLSKNNYMYFFFLLKNQLFIAFRSALQEEKSYTYKTANSHLKNSVFTLSDQIIFKKDREYCQVVNKSKYKRPPLSEKNYCENYNSVLKLNIF